MGVLFPAWPKQVPKGVFTGRADGALVAGDAACLIRRVDEIRQYDSDLERVFVRILRYEDHRGAVERGSGARTTVGRQV